MWRNVTSRYLVCVDLWTNINTLFGMWQVCGEPLPRVIWHVAGVWRNIASRGCCFFGMWHVCGETLLHVVWYVLSLWRNVNTLIGMWQVCGQTLTHGSGAGCVHCPMTWKGADGRGLQT